MHGEHVSGGIDKSRVRKVGLNDQSSDVDYWRSRPPAERLKMLEFIRREYHGWPEEGSEDGDVPGLPPMRIDLLTSVSGLKCSECYSNRREIELDGVCVPFVGLEDLKRTKRATGRHQDLADLENLEES